MGGPGSTRWRQHRPKPLVEETPHLDLLEPQWRAILAEKHAEGTLRWVVDSRSWENPDAGEVAFRLEEAQPDGSRVLVLSAGGSHQRVVLEPLKVGFSRRLYARCPKDCGRRVRIIYMIARQLEFGCRECAGLQYRSAQRHDRRLDLARRDPAGFQEERAQHQSLKSRLVTARLVMDALEMWGAPRRGRGWSRGSR